MLEHQCVPRPRHWVYYSDGHGPCTLWLHLVANRRWGWEDTRIHSIHISLGNIHLKFCININDHFLQILHFWCMYIIYLKQVFYAYMDSFLSLLTIMIILNFTLWKTMDSRLVFSFVTYCMLSYMSSVYLYIKTWQINCGHF